jgi:uncharacterized damage-inducible protein DinB
MELLLSELSDRLEAMHRIIERSLADLSDEALDWSPGPEMNALGVLLAHTFGSERYWIGDVAGGEPSGRVREEEFKTAGVSAAEFMRRSQETLAHSQSVLARLTPQELARHSAERRSGGQEAVTGAWAILHALEHVAIHAGHIELTRQLWQQKSGGQ